MEGKFAPKGEGGKKGSEEEGGGVSKKHSGRGDSYPMPSAEARTRPPKQPASGGGDEEHQRRVKAVNAKIDRALKASGLTQEQRDEVRKSIRAVVARMTPTALARMRANVKEYKFYPSLESLTAGIQAKYPTYKPPKGKVPKGLFDKDGTLHTNGRGDGRLFGRPASFEEIHAHELAHGIDGTGHEISESEPWKKAWKAERDFFTHGKTSEAEGFAEFCQMLLGQGITRKQMKEAMPKCLKVWEANGL